MGLSWDELAAASLARQFPDDPGTVAERVRAIGDVQTQTARSAFIGLGARFPGVTHAEITAAYDAGEIVRGSTIRGTVHTATPEAYTVLAEATRVGQHQRWARVLGISDAQIADLWVSIEAYARAWRTPDELRAHVDEWLARHAPASLEAAAAGPGRYLGFAHGALVRRPASGDRWEGQGKPVYGTFDRTGPVTLADVVRLHLRAHGPSSRQDVAWWAGVPLKAVEEGLAGLDVVEHDGPDGRAYVDLPGSPPPRDLPGVRLLPEFDALLCGYDPKARDRFVTPEQHALLWNQNNGLLRAPLLHGGRIAGWWRFDAKTSLLEVTPFPGVAPPSTAELEPAVDAAATAMGWAITTIVGACS